MMATKTQANDTLGNEGTTTTTNDKQADIEHRLAMLGETPAVGSPTPAPAPAAKSNKSALLVSIESIFHFLLRQGSGVS